MNDIPTELSDKVVENYSVENNTFYKEAKDNPKDKLEVEVGDIKQPDFYPQVKLKRWDNETNLSIRLKTENLLQGNVTTDKDSIVWDNGNLQARFYNVPDLNEDGYEFEVLILEKPISNVVEFTLQTKNLDFFYQPELKDSEVKEMADREKISLLEAKRICRPENIVGSYAVYYKDYPANIVDGKEYKTGKLCHIYRPLIIDSSGSEVWGELNVNEEQELLTITIPQEFLDKAIYPILVDPTFGYTTAGASTAFRACLGSYFTGSEGTVTSISMYAHSSGASGSSVAIYKKSDLSLKEGTNIFGDSLGSSYSWNTINLSGSTSILSTDYILLVNNINAGIYCKYDTGVTNQGYSANPFYSWPNPLSGTSNDTNKYSIYATYTAGGGDTTTPQTLTGKARIEKSTQQTLTGKSRITTTTSQSLLGKSKIELPSTTISKTLQGLSRIEKITPKTLLGKARIGLITNKTLTGVSRVSKTVDKTLLGKSRITAVTSKVLQGLSRIETVTPKTLQGKANILVTSTTSKILQGISRITATNSKILQGKSRIEKITPKTLLGKSNIIVTSTIDKTLQGLARIDNSAQQSIQGKANIIVTGVSTQTLQGKADILKSTSQTLQGLSRITVTTSKTLLGKARILVNTTTSKTLQGISRIQTSTSKSLLGKARIGLITSKSLLGKASILVTLTTGNSLNGKSRIQQTSQQSLQGKAKILVSGTSVQALLGKADILKSNKQELQGKSRIGLITSKSIIGKSNIIVTSTTDKTLTGKSRITKSTDKTLLGKSRIAATTSKSLLGKARISTQAGGIIPPSPQYFILLDEETGILIPRPNGKRLAVTVKTISYNVTRYDEMIVMNSTSPTTVTLPIAIGCGQTYRISNENTGLVTIVGTNSDVIKGELNQTLNQGEDILISDYSTGKWC